MDSVLLETLTRKYLALDIRTHTFAWQGGEPVLMGLRFFKDAVRLQRKYAKRNSAQAALPANAIQTNGTLLDDEWCAFFAENKFLVGISIDGPARMHDFYRRNSHADMLRGVGALQRNGCDFNALTVVSAANQDHPEEIYGYLKSLGINFHQYIECVEFGEDGNLAPFAVSPEKWGEFLCRIFDEWHDSGDCGKVSVRLFDSLVSRLVTGVPTICPMAGDCRNYLVIECDGSAYPCDFHVTPESCLGNVKTDSFATLRGNAKYAAFGKRKKPDDDACMSCKWLPLCMGDCPKNRPPKKRSALCAGWKIFYSHTIERFERIAGEV